MSLEEYIVSAPRDAFWFFQHIPKTAGSSFSTELSRVLYPYHNISASDVEIPDDYDEAMRQALDGFLERPDLASFRSASGHLLHPMTRKMLEYIPSMEMVTFLRNPVDRVISDYRYRCTEMHPGAADFRQRYPTLESFANDPASQNQMAHFIGDAEADREEIMARIERDFAFVGLVEIYPFSFNIMLALMGLPDQFPSEHIRKTPDTAENGAKVDYALRRHIQGLNRLDADLYAQVRDILGPHAEQWRKEQMFRPPPKAGPVRNDPPETTAG